jgi:hypothetical protein
VGQPKKQKNQADQKPDAEDYDYTEAIEANADLVERLRHGDVHALASLVQAVTGVKVTSSRTIEPSR